MNMNWDALGAFAELAGAIAVVASLFYVGIQVRENSRAVRGQTFDSIATGLNQAVLQMVGDAELIEIIQRGVANGELSEIETLRYNSWMLVLLRSVESAHHQFELGLLDEAKLKPLVANMGLHFSSASGQLLWESRRHLYEADFTEFVDELVNTAERGSILRGYGVDT